jgi:beta-glucosidase/6-phospho-beta-glucosidase/beta-galactosidase
VLDERFEYAVTELGLTVVADLVHYGTPTWLTDSFGDARYPEAIAQFAGRFAARYRGLVEHITPLNEPITTASFCGLRGVWPPALIGWDGWTTVTLAIVDGLRRSIAAIRQANPDAQIVHVEASSLYETDDAELQPEVEFLEAVAILPTELLLGRVSPDHPQWRFLVEHGADPHLLRSFTESVPAIDVLGVNYYPDLTPRHLRRMNGVITQATQNKGAEGLRLVLQKASDRFGIPLAVTETSIEGTEEVRRNWLDDAAALVTTMHHEGLDIRGFTWWPLLDFVDWSYASGGRNVEEFVLDPGRGIAAEQEWFAEDLDDLPSFFRRMGLLHVTDDTLVRRPTTAAQGFINRARAGRPQGDDLASQR